MVFFNKACSPRWDYNDSDYDFDDDAAAADDDDDGDGGGDDDGDDDDGDDDDFFDVCMYLFLFKR